MIDKNIIITSARKKMYLLDAETIAFYRRNPCIAAEDLLGIKLFDAQKYILESMWNASHVAACCSRNFGKSFLCGAVFLILKAILYEDQSIYIISSVGDQAKETFTKAEEVVLRSGKTSSSIRSLKDIASKEVVTSPTNKTGFNHGNSGYRVKFYNGSMISTLNSDPNNARSRRASVVFFDEAAFCLDELIVVCEAFATQNSEFVTDIDDDYNPNTEPRKVPTQLVYASSQDSMDKLFYKRYKEFAKRMIAGDRDYFVCDMICDTAITVYMNGSPYPSLLTQEKVDAALKSNKEKGLREYYNRPTLDGGISQIIKWGTIRRNERPIIPQIYWKKDTKMVIAFDPARTGDNSIIGAMSIYQDPDMGWCGDIVNCINLIDIASKKHYKLDSNRQLEELRNTILQYNGQNPDYEYIDQVLIDAGAGGGGTSTYADSLLNNWTDKYGKEHRGLIDANNDLYAGYSKLYPDAIDKLRLLSPKKYRTQMVEEFIELMNLGVIRFPYEYSGKSSVRYISGEDSQGNDIISDYELNQDEELALINIDLMKMEIANINKTTNPENTSVTYALSKEKENKMHDDRFFCVILLAHRLYELRRGTVIRDQRKTGNLSSAPNCVSVIDF